MVVGGDSETRRFFHAFDNLERERYNFIMVTAETQLVPIKCPRCQTGGFYFRQADRMYVCKKCGHTWSGPPIVVEA